MVRRPTTKQWVRETVIARDQGRCIFEITTNKRCRKGVILVRTAANDVKSMGRLTHNRAASPGGKRYDSSYPFTEQPANLMWMCAEHANLIDVEENVSYYTIDRLQRWTNHSAQLAIASQTQDQAPLLKLVKDYSEQEDRARYYSA